MRSRAIHLMSMINVVAVNANHIRKYHDGFLRMEATNSKTEKKKSSLVNVLLQGEKRRTKHF